MRRTCPDLAHLMQFLTANNVPLIGVSVTPSFRVEGKILPKTPRFGFVKHEQVIRAAKQHGIPDQYVPKKRVPADAFRSAVSAVGSDPEFKSRGLLLKQWTVKDGWTESNPCYVVMRGKGQNASRQYMEAHTIQSVRYDLDTGQIDTEVFHDRDYVIIAPAGKVSLITPSVMDYYMLFGTCCTTQDISHMVARLLRDFCDGVPLRKGGGQYFIPRDDSTPHTINAQLDQVQAFVEEVRQAGGPMGTGGVGCHWTPFPLLDFAEIRDSLKTHVQADLAQQAQTKIEDAQAMLLAVKTSGDDAVRDSTKRKSLREIGDLQRKIQLYERVLETDLAVLHQANDLAKGIAESLLTGRPLPAAAEAPEPEFDLADFLFETAA